MSMTPVEKRALQIRQRAVHSVGFSGMDALAHIVMPDEDVRRASETQAVDELEAVLREAKRQRESNRLVSLDDLLATL